jgi:HAD superfamily hydrolase (TIGR01490 family)
MKQTYRAAFFDVDGTLTTSHVWHGMMSYFKTHRKRKWTNRFFWWFHSPYFLLRRLGLISEGVFRKPWAAHLAWYVRGYTSEQAKDLWDWIVEEYLSKVWRTDTRHLLDEHRAEGDLVVLVSGGPLPLLRRIAQELGVDHVVGTEFEIKNGRFTGRSKEPICIDENKAKLTRSYLEDNDLEIDMEASFAFADSASDLPLLKLVGHPVATYPNEGLEKVARERGWRLFP